MFRHRGAKGVPLIQRTHACGGAGLLKRRYLCAGYGGAWQAKQKQQGEAAKHRPFLIRDSGKTAYGIASPTPTPNGNPKATLNFTDVGTAQ